MFGNRLGESSLRVHRLPLETFQSWMFLSKDSLYQEEVVENGTAILHFTCAQGTPYKDYLAKALGTFKDARTGYYCSPQPTLEVDILAWRGTVEQLAARLAFAIHAAKATGRALVLGKWAWVEHEAQTHRLPFIRVFSLLAGPIRSVQVRSKAAHGMS